MKDIDTIQIPHRVISGTNVTQFYLHAFCDASLKAYGVCIYLQTTDKDNNFRSALPCSKLRVVSIKNIIKQLPYRDSSFAKLLF